MELARRYLQNARETLKKAGVKKRTGRYEDIKYVSSAAGIAYLAALEALKALFIQEGLISDLRKVKNVRTVYSLISRLTRIGKDRDVLKDLFDDVYKILHVAAYYRELQDKKSIDSGFEKVEKIIRIVERHIGAKLPHTRAVRGYNEGLMKSEKVKSLVVKGLIVSMLTSSPVGFGYKYDNGYDAFSKYKKYKPTPEFVISLRSLEAITNGNTYSISDVLNMIKTGKSGSISVEDVSILKLGDVMNDYVNAHRQIISSVDGLGAAVDSLKANDAAVIEYHDKRVFDYKVGSLSGGKDVYVGVEARNISRGGYSLLVYLYLVDRNTGDTLSLGGLGLSRWGMPHTLRNSPIERRFAYLWEDVQSFIKALRVYEFKDRYVAFFAAQEYYPRIKKYKHIHRVFVIPNAKKGEEGWFEPYYGSIDFPGMKSPLNEVYDVFTNYDNYFLGTILAVLKSNNGVLEEYYGVSFAVDENSKKPYGIIESTNGVNIPKDVGEWVLIGSK